MSAAVPLYYFHVRTDVCLVEDEDGVELPDVSSVMTEALVSAYGFLTDVDWSDPLSFEVADGRGRIVLRLSIEDLARAWQRLITAAQEHNVSALH